MYVCIYIYIYIYTYRPMENPEGLDPAQDPKSRAALHRIMHVRALLSLHQPTFQKSQKQAVVVCLKYVAMCLLQVTLWNVECSKLKWLLDHRRSGPGRGTGASSGRCRTRLDFKCSRFYIHIKHEVLFVMDPLRGSSVYVIYNTYIIIIY